MPESRYNPESNDLTRKTLLLEEVLTTIQVMLIKVLVSLYTCKQIIMSQEAQLVFLKNIDVLKSHLSAGDQDEEEDNNTIINGEIPGNNNYV